MAKKDVANNKKEKKPSKNKKSFLKGVRAELKKVNWLTPKQLVNSTATVIALVFICAAIVFVLDLGFEALNKQGVEKLKEYVSTSSEENTNTNNTNESTDNSQNVAGEGESTTGNNETENQENSDSTEGNQDTQAANTENQE